MYLDDAGGGAAAESAPPGRSFGRGKMAGPSEPVLWVGHPSIWLHGNRLVFAVLLSLVLIGLPWLLWLWLVARTTEYRVTSQRLIWRRGVLSRREDQVELYRVRDILLEQPFMLRVIGLGNVGILSSDITTPNEWFLAIRDCTQVRDLVRTAVEERRGTLGIRALDVETR